MYENALHNKNKDFEAVPIDEVTGNISIFCRKFYAYVFFKELRLNNDSSAECYK